jgi:hypothetical protein
MAVINREQYQPGFLNPHHGLELSAGIHPIADRAVFYILQREVLSYPTSLIGSENSAGFFRGSSHHIPAHDLKHVPA